MYIFYWCAYQKSKIFTILKLDHVKNTKDPLSFVLILSLATYKKNIFCNLLLIKTSAEATLLN